MARVKPQKTAKQKFAEAVSRHLTNGTRPGKAVGEPWTYEAFASEIVISQQVSDLGAVSPRSVSNWCNGRVLPREISPILSALFGRDSTSARADLDRLFRKAKQEQRITVSDNGRGIPFHSQAQIFDRFTSRDRGGPGLGLALVKALIEMHGGWIALESDPGNGATFTCHLPECVRGSDVSDEANGIDA